MESDDLPHRNQWILFLLESFEPLTRVNGFSQPRSHDSDFARIARPLHEGHQIPMFDEIR